MKKSVIAIAAALIGCMSAAQAAPAHDGAVVSYADLNLGSAVDAAVLVDRIESAARVVCGLNREFPMPIELRARMQRCATLAAARAIANVNAPLLTHNAEIVVR